MIAFKQKKKKYPLIPQVNIKKVLQRPNVKRSLHWLSEESKINHTLLHNILTGKRRLQQHHADKIISTLRIFGVNVTEEEIFIKEATFEFAGKQRTMTEVRQAIENAVPFQPDLTK